MKKLVIGEPGKWVRGSGEIVDIESMIDPHLHNALRIVEAKHKEATATMARVSALQKEYGTEKEPEAIATMTEIEKLCTALAAKKAEIESEIDSRPPRVIREE